MGVRKTRKGYKQLNVEVPTLIKDKILPEISETDKRSMAAEVTWLIERRAQEIKEGK